MMWLKKNGIRLYNPFPNPVENDVVLQYYLNSPQKISINIYDIQGKMVETLISDQYSIAGNHKITFNVDQIASGLYNVQLRTTQTTYTKSFVVLD